MGKIQLKTFKYTMIFSLAAIIVTTMFSCRGVFNFPEIFHFDSGIFNIKAELRKPDGKGPHPLVILVHGDGPAYRRYYSTLKECFLDAGYATLIWDKPGYGESTGKFSKNYLREERAGILVDAIEQMKNNPEIDEDRIGVWGISQAGYVIPRAYGKAKNIAFMILVGCAGENGIQQTAYLIRRQLESEGFTQEDALSAENDFIKLYSAESFEEYIKHAKPLYDNPIQRRFGFVSALWDKDNWKPHDPSDEGFYNPMDVIETIKIPALIFFGAKDTQVDPVQGYNAYKKAFLKSGNNNYRIEIIPDSDHDIILCKTGSIKERNQRNGEDWSKYAPEYLEIMETWLRALK